MDLYYNILKYSHLESLIKNLLYLIITTCGVLFGQKKHQ